MNKTMKQLYYLRDRKGKSSRIAEKIAKKIGVDILESVSENQLADKNVIVENQKKMELKFLNHLKICQIIFLTL